MERLLCSQGNATRGGEAAQRPPQRNPEDARRGREDGSLWRASRGRRARRARQDQCVGVRGHGQADQRAWHHGGLSDMSESTLGRDTPQVTARAKVLGRAQYAGDIKVAGMLHGKVLRSPYPSARIVRIDTSAARALPGVKAVVTGEDAPRTPWGVHHKERYILARGRVRFAGEEVAAVAAVSEEIARDALDLIEVEYEELDALLTLEAALAAPGLHAHVLCVD
eukprot:Opistho-1_new@56517